MTIVTVTVEVDLGEVDTDDLVEELKSRDDGQLPDPDGELCELLNDPSFMAWLRASNAPQALRDIVYNAKGVIV